MAYFDQWGGKEAYIASQNRRLEAAKSAEDTAMAQKLETDIARVGGTVSPYGRTTAPALLGTATEYGIPTTSEGVQTQAGLEARAGGASGFGRTWLPQREQFTDDASYISALQRLYVETEMAPQFETLSGVLGPKNLQDIRLQAIARELNVATGGEQMTPETRTALEGEVSGYWSQAGPGGSYRLGAGQMGFFPGQTAVGGASVTGPPTTATTYPTVTGREGRQPITQEQKQARESMFPYQFSHQQAQQSNLPYQQAQQTAQQGFQQQTQQPYYQQRDRTAGSPIQRSGRQMKRYGDYIRSQGGYTPTGGY